MQNGRTVRACSLRATVTLSSSRLLTPPGVPFTSLSYCCCSCRAMASSSSLGLEEEGPRDWVSPQSGTALCTWGSIVRACHRKQHQKGGFDKCGEVKTALWVTSDTYNMYDLKQDCRVIRACIYSFCVDAGAPARFARIATAIGLRCAELNASKCVGKHTQCEALSSCFTLCMVSNTFRSIELCTPEAYGSEKVGIESQLEDRLQMSIAI